MWCSDAVVSLRDISAVCHGGVELQWRAWCSVSVRWWDTQCQVSTDTWCWLLSTCSSSGLDVMPQDGGKGSEGLTKICSYFLPTVLPWKIMQLALSICLFPLLKFWLTFCVDLVCVWVMTIAHQWFKVKVIDQPQRSYRCWWNLKWGQR